MTATVVEEKTHPYLGLRHRTEGAVEGVLLGWDSRQGDVITDRLMHVKSRKGTRHWDNGVLAETKDLPKKQKCKFCANQATKRVIHSEGMAYVPTCDTHLDKAKDAAARCLPDGGFDMGNIDAVRDIKEDPNATEFKALDPAYAVEIDRWVNELKSTVETILTQTVNREAARAALDLKETGVLERLVADGKASGQGKGAVKAFASPRAAQDALDAQVKAVMGVVETAARNQSKRVAKKIAELDDSGASIKTIEAEVRKMIGTRSQWRKMLAVNATTTAIEGARQAVYGQGGAYLTKTWNTEGDERVRATHERLDHVSVKMDQPFNTGAATLQELPLLA
jgi:hypothetical protein